MHVSHESVEVVYTGDTVMEALVSQPLVWRARLVIMEVTYLDGDGAAAAQNHHIHVKVRMENGFRRTLLETDHSDVVVVLAYFDVSCKGRRFFEGENGFIIFLSYYFCAEISWSIRRVYRPRHLRCAR